jgi:PAS domain S-box-containing protein
MYDEFEYIESKRFLRKKTITDKILRTLALVLEGMPEGVNLSNNKGIILYTNPSFDALFGYNPGELIGSQVSDLTTYSSEEKRELYRRINQTIDEQEVWCGEISCRKKDGTVFDAETRINAVEIGHKRCLISVQSDISDRKRTETALLESEMKYRTVSENTCDWIFWISPERKFIYISPSCQRISGYGLDEFMADPDLLYQIIHPDDQPFFFKQHEESERQIHTDEVEFRIIHKDGSIRRIGHVCQSIFDNNGNFLGKRASNRDITKRKLVENEVRKMSESPASATKS